MTPLVILLLLDVSGSVDVDWTSAALPAVESMGDGDEIAVVTFGSGASVVFPMGPAGAGEDGSDLVDALRSIVPGDAHTDLVAGLGLALETLEGGAPAGSTRAVILVTDGRLDPPPGSPSAADPGATLAREALPGFVLAGIPVHTIGVGRADLPLLRQIASATGGRSISAPDEEALGQAMALVVASVSASPAAGTGSGREAGPPAPETTIAAPSSPGGAGEGASGGGGLDDRMAMALAVALFVSFQIALIVMIAGMARSIRRWTARPGRRRDRRKIQPADVSPLARMRLASGDIRDLLEEARSRFESLDLDMEDHGADLAGSERESEARYGRLADGMLLLVDHLEVLAAGGPGRPPDDEARWILAKARRVLGDAGIEEMDVIAGSAFDGRIHRVVGEREDRAPAGTVIEVARRGWRAVGRGPDPAVLRPAEVVVSTGAAARHGGGDG